MAFHSCGAPISYTCIIKIPIIHCFFYGSVWPLWKDKVTHFEWVTFWVTFCGHLGPPRIVSEVGHFRVTELAYEVGHFLIELIEI